MTLLGLDLRYIDWHKKLNDIIWPAPEVDRSVQHTGGLNLAWALDSWVSMNIQIVTKVI